MLMVIVIAWVAVWVSVEAAAMALTILNILSIYSNIIPFAFAMALLAAPAAAVGVLLFLVEELRT